MKTTHQQQVTDLAVVTRFHPELLEGQFYFSTLDNLYLKGGGDSPFIAFSYFPIIQAVTSDTRKNGARAELSLEQGLAAHCLCGQCRVRTSVLDSD